MPVPHIRLLLAIALQGAPHRRATALPRAHYPSGPKLGRRDAAVTRGARIATRSSGAPGVPHVAYHSALRSPGSMSRPTQALRFAAALPNDIATFDTLIFAADVCMYLGIYIHTHICVCVCGTDIPICGRTFCKNTRICSSAYLGRKCRPFGSVGSLARTPLACTEYGLHCLSLIHQRPPNLHESGKTHQ